VNWEQWERPHLTRALPQEIGTMTKITSLRFWLRNSGQRHSRRTFGWVRPQVEALETRAVPASLTVGANVNTGHMAGSQSETAIAVDPANPKLLFVETNDNAAINGTGSGMYVSRSADGGATWKASVVAAGGADGLPLGFTDPSLAWDSFGNLFMSYIDTPAAGGSVSQFTIALSTNGGATFKSIATLNCADQPHLAVGAGEIAAVCNNTSVQVSSAKVTGLGAVGAFSTVTVPNTGSPTFGNFGGITIGPAGQIVVCFQSGTNNPGPDTIKVSSASGVGAAFSNPTVATPTNVGGFRAIPAQPVRTIDSESKLTFDLSNGPHRGRLYLVYTDAPSATSNDTNIFLRHSDNNGATWSAPLRVNDDKGTNSQFFSSLAVDQTTGNLALAWYDCRNSAANNQVECFATASINGGASVLPNVQVAKGLSSAIAASDNTMNDYGDFMTVCFTSGHFFPCWVDNSTTLPGNSDRPNFDIGTAQVTLQLAPTPPGPGPSSPIPKIFLPFRYTFDPFALTYTGTLTLTNVGGGFLTGPATFLFPQLPPGVTLANATGFRNGVPFIKVSFSPLGANQSVGVTLVFNDPFNVPLSTFLAGFPVQLILG
jgi:hypothetical protein